MSTLHAIFEHAVRLGRIEVNPAKGVRKLAAQPRERRLSRAEIERLGKTLRAVAEEGEHPTGLAAIRFLLLTGFRRMEGLGLERTWLDEEEEAIRFPDTKSGAQTRVIGAPPLSCCSTSQRRNRPTSSRPIGARAILSVWSGFWIGSVRRHGWPTSHRTPCAIPLPAWLAISVFPN